MIHLAKDLGKFWSRTEWIGLVHLEEAWEKWSFPGQEMAREKFTSLSQSILL